MSFSDSPAASSYAKFISGPEIRRCIQNILIRPEEALLAVAFWGKDAAQDIGLKVRHATGQGLKTRAICDLSSGACNPDEIARLVKLSPSCLLIQTLDGLHAKVYSAGNEVIVGSANASINGLGTEEIIGKRYEACIHLVSDSAAFDVKKWFEAIWPKSSSITDKMLKDAAVMWNNRQRRAAEIASSSNISDSDLLTHREDPAFVDEWFDERKIEERQDEKSIFIGIMISKSRKRFFFSVIGEEGTGNTPAERLKQLDGAQDSKYSSSKPWSYIVIIPINQLKANLPDQTKRLIFQDVIKADRAFRQIDDALLIEISKIQSSDAIDRIKKACRQHADRVP